VDLDRRATEPELLDLGVGPAEARRSLADLRLVNRWLGGRRALLAAVRPFVGDGGRLLDVGCGSGDLPSLLVKTFPGLRAVGVDLKLSHLREAPDDVARVVADVRALPFPPRSFDLVTASLFVHHFDGPEVATLLRSLASLARRALVVNDLRRARVPYLFGRIAFPLLFRSRVSVEDGLTSIRRGFTRDELSGAFAEAGLPAARIARRWPYRLVAVAEPHGG
jgi:SAM-dependent methyltransferase